ncbi:MAG TPA: ATP-binding protein [Bryobacteraceae bacterium]|nr:ATP-binding protein [Bryobacteraceae bacterium]
MLDLRRYLRPQDFVWLLAFAAIAIFSPYRDPRVLWSLAALAVLQIFDARMAPATSILIKFFFIWIMIYYADRLQSGLWVILLLPVISAATSFGILGTSIFTLLACLHNASFILLLANEQYVDWTAEAGRQFALRMITLIVVGFLVNQLAEASRRETRRFQETAAKLETAVAQVRRSERLAALGQLTAGLAHELRNPLGTMKTSAELLTRSVGKDNPIAHEMASYISTEVDRTNSLITRFLDFARPQHLRREPGDISTLLDQAVASFYRERPASLAGIEIYKNYSPGIPPVKFDAELLERVFSNLILNAAQASPPGGVVTVKTQLLDDNKVEVAVIDRGTGIDAKNLESIFNPFFTTKPDGVGLGLAICSKIIDEHGGQITVESSSGEGSVFHVILPV